MDANEHYAETFEWLSSGLIEQRDFQPLASAGRHANHPMKSVPAHGVYRTK